MRRRVLLMSVIGLASCASAFAVENVFDKSERKTFSEMFAKWFDAMAQPESTKQMASQVKAFEELNSKLKDLAKRKKLDPLASPGELRTLMMVPFSPEKSPQKGRWWERDIEPGNKTSAKYLLWLPKNYSHDVATPAVIALHPPMKKVDDLKKWASEAYPPAIADSAMIILPVNVENPIDWAQSTGDERIILSIDETAKHFYIDRLRVVVDGDSSTAGAAIAFAAKFPSLVSGVVIRRPESIAVADVMENLRSMKVAVVASGDGDAGKTAAKAIDDLKAKGVEAALTTTVFEGVGSAGEAGSQAIAAFVTANPKNPAPKKLRVVTKNPVGVAYWLEFKGDVPKNGEFWIEAEVFSDRNEIKLTSPPGLRNVKINLNDDLLDMGKSIKIVHEVVKKDADGKETREEPKVCFEGTKARKLENALQQWHVNNLSNFGEVYLNGIEIAF